MAELRMPELNVVVIAGRLTRDPEPKTLTSGVSLCTFSIAVDSTWKDAGGERQKKTAFIDVQTWRKTADYCGENLRKGDPVVVQGRLVQDEYEDKEGRKVRKTRVEGQRVDRLSWPADSGGDQGQRETRGEEQDAGMSDDIPF
jgi:single-strand DNA-binding protein